MEANYFINNKGSAMDDSSEHCSLQEEWAVQSSTVAAKGK